MPENPYSQIKSMAPIQKAKNLALSATMEVIEEIKRTFNIKNGRCRVKIAGSWRCYQYYLYFPILKRFLIFLFGKYYKGDGLKFIYVGQTNILYRAQMWVDGAKKSILKMV